MAGSEEGEIMGQIKKHEGKRRKGKGSRGEEEEGGGGKRCISTSCENV